MSGNLGCIFRLLALGKACVVASSFALPSGERILKKKEKSKVKEKVKGKVKGKIK